MTKNEVRVAHGDCLEVLTAIATGSVDMVFADLPYGVTGNKWDTVIPFAPLWEQLLRVGKNNCAYVFTATQPFATALICSQPKLFRYDLIWQKTRITGFLNAKKMPLRNHENMLIFARSSVCYNPQKTLSGSRPRTINGSVYAGNTYGNYKKQSHYADGSLYPRSVVQFGVPEQHQGRGIGTGRNVLHPAQKPVGLLEYLIKTYSNEGDLVLDPTMGSGTTGVACISNGRRFLGIEMDAAYYAIAKNRLRTTQKAA